MDECSRIEERLCDAESVVHSYVSSTGELVWVCSVANANDVDHATAEARRKALARLAKWQEQERAGSFGLYQTAVRDALRSTTSKFEVLIVATDVFAIFLALIAVIKQSRVHVCNLSCVDNDTLRNILHDNDNAKLCSRISVVSPDECCRSTAPKLESVMISMGGAD